MNSIDRRGNVRVRDRIHVAYRLVAAEDIAENDRPESYFPFIWNKYPQALPLEEVEEHHTRMLHHIVELHRKMDILIETVSPENRTRVEVPKERDVCISASGMRVPLDGPAAPGLIIMLCIVLPFIPPANIFVKGEVIRSETPADSGNEDDAEYGTGITFLEIKEDDREALIRYIFKRQRDLLRDRAVEKVDELQSLSEENE